MVWQVQVTLAESAELEVLTGTDKVYRGCVCADEERTFQWSVRATSMGTEGIAKVWGGGGEPRGENPCKTPLCHCFSDPFLPLPAPSPLPSLPFPFSTLQPLPSISQFHCTHCTLLLPRLPGMALSWSQPLRQCRSEVPHLPPQGR